MTRGCGLGNGEQGGTAGARCVSSRGGPAFAFANRCAFPDVNRILFVKNLPFKMSGDEMYELFGKYGAIRQVRARFFASGSDV